MVHCAWNEPPEEGILVVGSIGFVLAGAFPLVHFVQKRWKNKKFRFGERFFMNETALSGWVSSFAHVIPMFALSEEMKEEGKIMNFAFAVSDFNFHHPCSSHHDKKADQYAMTKGTLAGIATIPVGLLYSYCYRIMKKPAIMVKGFQRFGTAVVVLAFILGGHLAFTAAVDKDMIVPMLIGNFSGGIAAMAVAYWMIKKLQAS
ncbi:ethanolamine utilization protein EutH [Alteribacillus sp. JSM 102045]|uniref:ethanolamine utilization protein EutH n=1 Tax=Alteribacillus sp. JSM 102045 TaxID=1562101 RepID=UPI0035C06204